MTTGGAEAAGRAETVEPGDTWTRFVSKLKAGGVTCTWAEPSRTDVERVIVEMVREAAELAVEACAKWLETVEEDYCVSAWTDRGLHSPDCAWASNADNAQELRASAARIVEASTKP